MKKNYTIPRNQLDGVEAFLRVADRRSFRAAADDLAVSPSAVSQTIKILEERIGVALLTRTTRSVGLTEAGQRFLERVRPAFEDLNAAYDAARSFGDRPAGLLRLNVPRSVIPHLIEPVLKGFAESYPAVEVEVFGEDGFIDLVEGGFDAGIRLGEFLQADMISLRLTPPFRFIVAGSPDYFERNGRPSRPEDLRDHRCIRVRQPSSGAIWRWEFQDGNQSLEISVGGPLIVNDLTLNTNAAVQGIGLAYLAEPLVWDHLGDGRLETVLDAFACSTPGAYLYYPSRVQMLPKLRAFIDYMKANLPPERLLEAQPPALRA
jgi:DNA-binding transcriptional LysR family regulator